MKLRSRMIYSDTDLDILNKENIQHAKKLSEMKLLLRPSKSDENLIREYDAHTKNRLYDFMQIIHSGPNSPITQKCR